MAALLMTIPETVKVSCLLVSCLTPYKKRKWISTCAFCMVTSDWYRKILNSNPNAKIPPVMERSITGEIFIFFLEAPANPCIPLPWDSNITAKGLLYVKIEMCYVAQIEIGADSHFPPTSTEILFQCS